MNRAHDGILRAAAIAAASVDSRNWLHGCSCAYAAVAAISCCAAMNVHASGSCPDVPSGQDERYTSWFLDKVTGRQLSEGEILPVQTVVTWHGRAEAYGTCTIYVREPSGQCVISGTQERTVAKIARAFYTPSGLLQLYHDTFFRDTSGGPSGGHVLDTTDTVATTGPRDETISQLGPYRFFSDNIMVKTACDFQPDRLSAPMFTLYGRAPKKRCLPGNAPALFGNPCDALNGVKSQVEPGFIAGPFAGNRYYSSDTSQFDMGLGLGWSSQLTRRLERGGLKLNIVEADGRSDVFTLSNGVWVAPADTKYSVSNVGSEYLVQSRAGAIERFNAAGKLLTSTDLRGRTTTYSYDGLGQLTHVEDPFGRWLNIVYSGGRIASQANGAGELVAYQYAANGTLSSVTYPDGSRRSYTYDVRLVDQYVTSALLTGIVDERGLPFAAWSYATDGKVASSANAPAEPTGPVNAHQFSYGNGVNRVVDTFGVNWDLAYTTAGPGGSRVLTKKKNVADNTSISQKVDANGNLTQFTDQLGVRTCFAYDTVRQIETHRVEGVAASVTSSCGYLALYGNPPAGARKTWTQWHPTWDLRVKVAEPGTITTWVYNGQADPFNGGAVASCAPGDAILPNGAPIAVLCRMVQQATTDATGAAGFNAVIQSGTLPREWRWTYNGLGQVLSEDGPRTDVSDVQTYVYYDDTTADHTRGDLRSVTNAGGQVINYTRYNPNGQVLQKIDVNGLTTDYTYDSRQRLAGVSDGGQTTTYEYELTGDLRRVMQPDGSYVEYTYDAARRLTRVRDQRGNRIVYTLDNAGNRVREAAEDPSGTLSRQLARVIDTLGRVQQTTGRE